MDLEKVALEAVKVKIGEIFDKISITAEMEGRSIVLRINLPDEIMNTHPDAIIAKVFKNSFSTTVFNNDLDKEAQQAADELLGVQE